MITASLGLAQAHAQQDAINSLVNPDSAATSQGEVLRPADTGPAGAAPDATVSPAGRMPTTGGGKPQKERWIEGDRPIENLQVVSSHPLPGSSCQKVIFDGERKVKKRFEPSAGGTLSFKVDELCMIALRNDSQKRAFVIRLDDGFDSLAIVADPELFTGQTIAPGQEIVIPVRPLPMAELDVAVDIVWESDLKASSPDVDRLKFRFLGK